MDDREILLQKLYGAKDIIEQAENLTRKYNAVKSKLQDYRRPISAESSFSAIVRKILLGIPIWLFGLITLLKVVTTLRKNFASISDMRSMINWIIFYLIIILVIVVMQWRHLKYCSETDQNRQMVVNKQNEEIAKFNEIIEQEVNEINQEIQEVREIARQRLEGWYPPDYAHSEAVNSFIHTIKNHKADDITGAVNKYDREVYEREQIEIQKGIARSQEKLARQQVIQNILTAANLFTNINIERNTRQTAANTGEMTGFMRDYWKRHRYDKFY